MVFALSLSLFHQIREMNVQNPSNYLDTTEFYLICKQLYIKSLKSFNL